MLIVAGAIAYANSIHGVFTFDDIVGIVDNETIRNLWPLTGPLVPLAGSEPVAGRPLVNLTFAINYALDGLEVRGYHLVNIALHLVCALLLFALSRGTLRLHRDTDTQLPDSIAGIAALIWVVHPLTTEAVTYVSQRTELMMATFLLATLYSSMRAATGVRLKPDTTYGGMAWKVAAVVSCALGVACKETMAVTPLLVVLYDRTFIYWSFAGAMRARWPFYLSLAATWGILAAMIWSGPRWETAGFSTGVPVWTWLLNQCVMIGEYLRHAVWPVALVHDYGEPVPLALIQVLPQALLVVSLLVLVVIALIRWPRLGMLGAAFFILLAPTSSFVPIATEVGADRRMYLPLAALTLLFAVGLWRGWRAVGARRLPAAGLVAIGSALAVPLTAATIDRNAEYASEMTLWQTSLERWSNPRAHRNFATVLKREGRHAEVIEQLRLALHDAHPEVRYQLGVELVGQGRRSEGIEELRQFLREAPEDPVAIDARQALANALLMEQRFAEAAIEYRIVTVARPAASRLWFNLGLALSQTGPLIEAIDAFRRAVELEPGSAAARRSLVACLLQLNRAHEALPHVVAAVQLEPADATGHFMLGVALDALGRKAEAADSLRRALALDPSLGEARELLELVVGGR